MMDQSFPLRKDRNSDQQRNDSPAVADDTASPTGGGTADSAQRFERRAESIATLLERQLEAVASFHDLSRRQLLASHRSVLKLGRGGGAMPTPQEFWEQTAQPQAGNLFDAARAAIDSEAAELTKALQQYATAVRLEIRAEGGSLDSDWSIADLCHVADLGIRRVAVTIRVLNEIDDLGRWWQDRLRRKAVLSVASKVLISPLRQFELLVSAAEMRLLEHPPWSHDDRLLSAFELAHSELREYAMGLEEKLQRQARSMLAAVAQEDLIDGPLHTGDAITRDAVARSTPARDKPVTDDDAGNVSVDGDRHAGANQPENVVKTSETIELT